MKRRQFSFQFSLPQPEFRFEWRSWLPSRGNVLFTLALISLLLWAQSAGAVPFRAESVASTSTIAYQGRLADSSGNPLTDTLNMSFRLYNAASGGAPLWTEQWTGSNGVQVSDGLFNVMLGSLTPIPASVITGNSSLFLGITVGTDDEMTPRVQLGSVPYAVQALTVPDGSITKAKLAADVTLGEASGWKQLSGVTVTRNQASDPEYVISIAGVDLTSDLRPGMRLKWDQNGSTRYAIVTLVSFSTNTLVTLYGGTDYDVDDSGQYPISNVNYSAERGPAGFPLNPDKWTITVTNNTHATQTTPAAGTWYNLGAISINVPTGTWHLSYKAYAMSGVKAYHSPGYQLTLADSPSTESDQDLTIAMLIQGLEAPAVPSDNRIYIMTQAQDNVSLSSARTYYLNMRASAYIVDSSISFRGDVIPTVIKAVSAYL